MRFLARLSLHFCALALLFGAGLANAVPANYVVTPGTLTTTGGCTTANACTYKAYQACVLSTQAVGPLIGTALPGTALPAFSGDTSSPPTVCIRAENASGNGTFTNVFVLNAVVTPPGPTTSTMTCTFAPGLTNFTCVAQ